MSLSLNQRIWSTSPDMWNQDSLQRTTEGVIALLLSLKKKPLIRYQKNSLLSKKLATEMRYQMTQEDQLFEFRKTDTPPILLIIDRRDDPVTPLLTQWTYQAMVHEMLGIENGRVNMSDVPEIRPEFKVSWLQHLVSIRADSGRKYLLVRTRTRSSRRTCTSILETWARMPKTTSNNSLQNSNQVTNWNR